MSSTIEGLERGVVGTKATLEKMHKLVALGKLDPTFQKIATWIRMSVARDRRGSTKETADAVFRWAQKHGIFQRDPFQIEKIEHPIEAMRPVIQNRAAGSYRGPGLFVGDCDTFAVVEATLLGVLGFQYAFETAKVDPDRPDEYSHVWTSALIDGGEWYPLDASTKGAYPGWHPPVATDKLARWPEKSIESVIKGGDMSDWNGRGLGDGESEGDNSSPLKDVDAEYAADYIGYGIPKDFGSGPGVIPDGNFENLQLLPPSDTQIPQADLESDMHFLKAAPTLEPSERIRSIAGQPDDHGNPYYRGAGRQPYYKTNKQPYPPGSRWNGDLGVDAVRYVKTDKYVQVKSAESPERRVEVQMHQPMLIRRRTVMTTPKQIPYGAMSGMGETDPETGITTFDAPEPTTAADASPATRAAANAGSSVWGAIGSIFAAAGKIVPTVIANTVARATNRVAGRPVMGVRTETSGPWYTNSWVLAFGALAIGGVGYVAIKMRPGVGGRRRRR